MKIRGGILVGSLFVGAWLLFDCQPARADALALSDITASNLVIADRGPGHVDFDPVFTALALAHAQNSLGDVDDQTDSETSAPAATSASVTWADGASMISDTIAAASRAHVPGSVDGAANSFGQALAFATFGVSCATCVGSTTVDFSVDLVGNLGVLTDIFGQFAQTETIFNLLVHGDTVLFRDDLLSIGPNDTKVLSYTTTLTGSMALDYSTPYDLVLRLDSESEVINTAPEPATVTLISLGLGALGARHRRRRSRTENVR